MLTLARGRIINISNKTKTNMHAHNYHASQATAASATGRQTDNPPAFSKRLNEATREVHVLSRLTASDYGAVGSPSDIEVLRAYSAALKGKRIIFINATYEGGGVAIMRAPLIALLRSVGVDAHWYVLKPSEAAFLVTKRKFHNVLQNVAGDGVELTARDKAIYEAWIKQNAEALADPISTADVIVIDDWQPSGLIPYIKGFGGRPGLNPAAKIIFRDHIQTEGKLMSTPGTPQHLTWDYIWQHNQVCASDVFVVHPKPEFVPPDVPDRKVVFVPAASDPLDDLNRPLSESENRAGLAFINQQLAENEHQSALSSMRPYVALVARFDPSKGMPNAMAAYALAREKMLRRGLAMLRIPQLVIVGNGSADDPDGVPVLREIMRLRRTTYRHIMADIKVARVPHNDIAINAVVRNSKLVIQPSTKEGFESRVTDAILQGKPVIGSRRGGIPLQIVSERSGFVIDPEDISTWAERICELMTNDVYYEHMRAQTKHLAKTFNYEYTTIPNALNWLHLSSVVLSQPQFAWNHQWARDLRAQSPQQVGHFLPQAPLPYGVPQLQPVG